MLLFHLWATSLKLRLDSLQNPQAGTISSSIANIALNLTGFSFSPVFADLKTCNSISPPFSALATCCADDPAAAACDPPLPAFPLPILYALPPHSLLLYSPLVVLHYELRTSTATLHVMQPFLWWEIQYITPLSFIVLHSFSELSCSSTYLTTLVNVDWIVVGQYLKASQRAHQSGPPGASSRECAMCGKTSPSLSHSKMTQPVPLPETDLKTWHVVPWVVVLISLSLVDVRAVCPTTRAISADPAMKRAHGNDVSLGQAIPFPYCKAPYMRTHIRPEIVYTACMKNLPPYIFSSPLIQKLQSASPVDRANSIFNNEINNKNMS